MCVVFFSQQSLDLSWSWACPNGGGDVILLHTSLLLTPTILLNGDKDGIRNVLKMLFTSILVRVWDGLTIGLPHAINHNTVILFKYVNILLYYYSAQLIKNYHLRILNQK